MVLSYYRVGCELLARSSYKLAPCPRVQPFVDYLGGVFDAMRVEASGSLVAPSNKASRFITEKLSSSTFFRSGKQIEIPSGRFATANTQALPTELRTKNIARCISINAMRKKGCELLVHLVQRWSISLVPRERMNAA